MAQDRLLMDALAKGHRETPLSGTGGPKDNVKKGPVISMNLTRRFFPADLRRGAVVWLFTLLVFSGARSTEAQTPWSQALHSAVRVYEDGDFVRALQLLDGVQPASLSTRDQAIRDLYRALILLSIGDEDGARRAMESSLSRDATVRPDPALHSPSRVDFFERVRAQWLANRGVDAGGLTEFDVAFRAAMQDRTRSLSEQCSAVERLIRSSRFNTEAHTSSSYEEAEDFLYGCRVQTIRNSCQALDDDDTNPLNTRFVFLNDDLNEAEFTALAGDIKTRLLGMDNLNSHVNAIDVYALRSPQGLLMGAADQFTLPGLTEPELHLARENCPGDMHIVLSGKMFEPATVRGTAVVSTAACRKDLRCMNIYTARSIAQVLFKSPPQPHTVTSPLSYNPLNTTLLELFSYEQQKIIDAFFRKERTP